MRVRLAQGLLCIFAAVLAGIIVLLPFHAFFSTWGGTVVGPLELWKSWKELALLALVPLVVLYLFLRPDVLRILWGRWLNKLIAAYVLLHALWAVPSPSGIAATLAGLAFNLRFLAIFVLAQLIVAAAPPWLHGLKKLLMPTLLGVVVIIGALAVAQVSFLPADFLAQFGYDKNTTIAPYILVDENQDALRAFATLRGPNALGAYLLLPLALALALVIDQRRNILAGAALGLGAVALALTNSRSAWLGAVVMLAVLACVWRPSKRVLKWLAWGAVPAVAVGALGIWWATTVPVVRLIVFHSSPGDSSLLEGSSEKHWQATYDGAQDALQKPFGQGVGTAGPASFYSDSPKIAENYFVQIMQEVGVAGVAVFVAINALLVAQLWRQRYELWPKLLLASFAGLTIINLFLHGWADDPTAMTWWALAGLHVFVSHAQQKVRSKK